ncbi:MAG: hypothetical protein ACRD3M_10695 [Thermoanaerobaculia bacterium]
MALALLGFFTNTTAEAGGPYVFFSVTPCRLADTRDPTGPTGGPFLTSGFVRSFPTYGSSARVCGIPSTAKAVAINGTVVGPTGDGFLVMFPYNTPVPGVSTINFVAGEPALANGQLVALTSDPTLQLSVHPFIGGGGTAHLVLDITGYFQEP